MKSVLNKREVYKVASGESLSLSCIVQHCGEQYDWKWIWKNSTDDSSRSVSTSDRHSLTSEVLSGNKMRLVLDFGGVSEEDEGFYGCYVKWTSGEVDQGHLMQVNVTAAGPSNRKVLHRILIYFGVGLCLAVVLGLGFCLRTKVRSQSLPRKFTALTSPRPMPCPSTEYQGPLHQSTPQPPPRRKTPPKHSSASEQTLDQPKQETEVLYADISQDALQRQQQMVRQSAEPSTVYSSVRFG